MNKTRKVTIAVLTLCMLACLGLFVLVGCSKSKDPELSKITITTPPTKTTYISGEKFDATGMVITASYVDSETTKDVTDQVTYDDPDLTVSSGNFEASKSITFSYTENEVTKTTKQTVTVTNKITAATITTMPTKTEYFVGNAFSPAGMVINATLQDGSTTSVTVTKDNATFSVTGALSKSDTEITVTIGGYDVKVPITIINTIYVEAESGYRNGSLIDQSTGDSGNLRTDAFTETIQTSVQSLYAAHLKAEFAVAQMKAADETFDEATLAATKASVDDLYEVFGGTKSVYDPNVTAGGEIVSKLYTETVKWLNDETNKEAIDAYLASDDYKNALEAYVAGTNADIAEWNYANDVTHYVAHPDDDGNEYYLGQNKQGNIISFLFDSSAATTGTVAFRLASAYLYADSGWKSIIMGDVQFNKFAEIYVNGVKMEISDDKVLLGGKTEDGSANNVLWCNWDTVEFTNIPFVQGRNVIELRILNHGIAAQESYDFAANIDTLLVEPTGADSELDLYDASKTATAAASSVKIAKTDDKIILTVEGTYSGITGYAGDQISVTVGGTAATVTATANSGKFTATLDVTEFDLGDYAIAVNGTTVTSDKATISTTTTITAGADKYANKLTLVADETSKAINLNVDSDYKVVVTSTTIKEEVTENDFSIVVEDEKVYIKLAVGVYDAEIIGYDVTNADDAAVVKALLESKIKALFYFDMQRNATWDYPLGTNFETMSVDLTAKTFTVIADVTNYPVHGDGATHGGMVHFVLNANSSSSKDYKPGIAFSKKVTLDGKEYEYACLEGTSDQAHCWNLSYVAVTDLQATTIEPESIEFKVENDKIYYVVNIKFENYASEEDVKAAVTKIDFEGNPKIEYTGDQLIMAVDMENGKLTVKVDITNLAVADYYWTHLFIDDVSQDLAINYDNVTPVEFGGKKYENKFIEFSWGTRYLLCISTVESSETPAE